MYGQAVYRLQSFIDEVTGHASEAGAPPGSSSGSHCSSSSHCSSYREPPFRTYQAFVWALYKYFSTFREELTAIERDLIGKGGSSPAPRVDGGRVNARDFNLSSLSRHPAIDLLNARESLGP